MNTNIPNENNNPVVDKYAILEKLDSLENHERECWKVLSEELPSKCYASYTNGKLDASRTAGMKSPTWPRKHPTRKPANHGAISPAARNAVNSFVDMLCDIFIFSTRSHIMNIEPKERYAESLSGIIADCKVSVFFSDHDDDNTIDAAITNLAASLARKTDPDEKT